jgi:hypothetical protein
MHKNKKNNEKLIKKPLPFVPPGPPPPHHTHTHMHRTAEQPVIHTTKTNENNG